MAPSAAEDDAAEAAARAGTFLQQLEHGKGELGQVLAAAAIKLDSGERGEPFLDWLGYAIATVLGSLSDAHQASARE